MQVHAGECLFRDLAVVDDFVAVVVPAQNMFTNIWICMLPLKGPFSKVIDPAKSRSVSCIWSIQRAPLVKTSSGRFPGHHTVMEGKTRRGVVLFSFAPAFGGPPTAFSSGRRRKCARVASAASDLISHDCVHVRVLGHLV